ncbi:Peroxidase [Novymonas esmeraldas]|uniref:Peroxidase n=1 Tax=Novymonas esmeraldas TaxID=1808958 RepID=A0AAW0EUB3_9TRYP
MLRSSCCTWGGGGGGGGGLLARASAVLRLGRGGVAVVGAPLLIPGWGGASLVARRLAHGRSKSSSSSSASPAPRSHPPSMFTAPPNVGPGRKETEEANPYKSWEHLSHSWLILMCVGCLCAGWLAGHFVEVDESKLKPKYAKEDIVAAACGQFEFRPDLAATSIRVAFVLAARRAGFPADTVDESCAVVRGLSDMAGVMNYLSNAYPASSTEDIASLAAIAGVKYLHGPYEAILKDWRWGRNDTDAPPTRNVPKDPSQTLFSIPTILHALGSLTEAECVALLACHSVGEFHEDVSGVDAATHTGKRYTLSNRYFQFLLEHEKSFAPLTVLRTQDNKDVAALPQTLQCVYVKEKVRGATQRRQCVVNAAELELLQRKTWRELVVRFAADEALWREHFQSAFTKMLDSNFKRLRQYSDPKAA